MVLALRILAVVAEIIEVLASAVVVATAAKALSDSIILKRQL